MTDTQTLLKELDPGLRPGEYVFCSVREASGNDFERFRPLATVIEDEGQTLVIEKKTAERARLDFEGVFRHLHLGVTSGLQDVGLSAAVCTALAERGISANVIAGRFHDHLLVPLERAGEALDVLNRLSENARAGPRFWNRSPAWYSGGPLSRPEKRNSFMIGYVTLGTNDLSRAAAFYDELLGELGAKRIMENEQFIAWATDPGATGLSVTRPHDGQAATVGNGVMVALAADSTETVDRVYAKAISLGARDEGPAGPRDGGFYAGYFRDLDGNKLNVFHFAG